MAGDALSPAGEDLMILELSAEPQARLHGIVWVENVRALTMS
jgi:hypothetical protein